ncbi:MAG: TM2 domain-containing protein [Spirulina sp. DLM2.Bin59]|nr:MAG: TM2 domain-containing protein [Spirulina sp. DLM2.Bin59]
MAEPTLQDAQSKKMVAGILGILLGTFGIHKFILGYTNEGLVMLLVSVLCPVIGTVGACLVIPLVLWIAPVVIWGIGLAEGIIYLTKSDEEFLNTYLLGKKGWF